MEPVSTEQQTLALCGNEGWFVLERWLVCFLVVFVAFACDWTFNLIVWGFTFRFSQRIHLGLMDSVEWQTLAWKMPARFSLRP